MYITANEVRYKGHRIPKGTRLSDVYMVHWGNQYYALAHHDGERIKIVVALSDLTTPPAEK